MDPKTKSPARPESIKSSNYIDVPPALGTGKAPEGVAVTRAPGSSQVEAELQNIDPTRYGDWEKKGRCIDF
jgi:hypothetical protein